MRRTTVCHTFNNIWQCMAKRERVCENPIIISRIQCFPISQSVFIDFYAIYELVCVCACGCVFVYVCSNVCFKNRTLCVRHKLFDISLAIFFSRSLFALSKSTSSSHFLFVYSSYQTHALSLHLPQALSSSSTHLSLPLH